MSSIDSSSNGAQLPVLQAREHSDCRVLHFIKSKVEEVRNNKFPISDSFTLQLYSLRAERTLGDSLFHSKY